jgi:hypothetical protein
MITNVILVCFGGLCMWLIGTTNIAKCKHTQCDCKECREKRRQKL